MKKGIRFGVFLLAWIGLVLTACTTAPASGEGSATRWEGTVEAILPDGLQVSGRLVRWNGQTQILGEIQVGSRVEVEGAQADGALNATMIRVQSSGGSVAGTAGGAMVSPLPTPIPQIEFRGVVEEVLPNGYRIAGQTVVVTTTTRIEGAIEVGVFVKVKGILLADGSVLALRIEVEAPPAEVEFKGVVEEVLPDGYRIAGRTVIVTTTTRIEGPITVGTFVEVKGVLQPDGTILASRIQREEKEERPEVEFQGVVEEILPNGYRIAGQTVIVTTTTRIDGPIAVGTFVEVKGVLQADGSVLALRIHVEKPEEARPEIEFKGTVEEILPNGYRVSGHTVLITDTTRIDGPIAVGTLVEVKGILQADGTVLALRIHVEDKEEQEEVEFKGAVEEILADGYRIAGRVVRVDASTRIDGAIAVGAWVEVKGFLQSDGSVRAVRIHLEDRSGKDSGGIQEKRDEGKKSSDEMKKDDSGKKSEDGNKDEDRHEEDDHDDHDD